MVKKTQWKSLTIVLVLILLFTTGFLALAAEYGSKDDPLVTLSYITDVVSPGALAKVDDKIDKKMDEFEKRLNNKLNEFDASITERINSDGSSVGVTDELVNAVAASVAKKIGADSASASSAQSAAWTLVDLESGKKLELSVGTEVILRIGTATLIASSEPGLINLTSGGELNDGAALGSNNLYIATIKDRRIEATENCKIFVRGPYVIS